MSLDIVCLKQLSCRLSSFLLNREKHSSEIYKKIKIHMKNRSPKRGILVLLLLVTSAVSVFGLSRGVGQDSMASFFIDSGTGNHVDSAGNTWYVPGFDYELANGANAKVIRSSKLGRTMVMTRLLSADLTAHTCNLACGKLTGANTALSGEKMHCVDNDSSFPYVEGLAGKAFYPHADFRYNDARYNFMGGKYDILCKAGSRQSDPGACSDTFFRDTIVTCTPCAKNAGPGESFLQAGMYPGQVGGSTFSDGAFVACAEPELPEVIPPTPIALSPLLNSTVVDDAFIVEVGRGQTGTSQCAQQGKICLGGALTNRVACKDFYPHALMNNEDNGYSTSFKCTGGSSQTVEPCVDTLEDTCSLAVSSGDEFGCDEPLKDGVDIAFVECADPFSTAVLNDVGGYLPPISTPAIDITTGYVPYTATISHPLDLETYITVHYRVVGESESQLATLHPTTNTADVNHGTADLDVTLDSQIGSVDAIDTDSFDEVIVNFTWDPRSDLIDTTGTYVIIVTVTDERGNTTTDTSPEFILDYAGLATNSEEPVASVNDIDGDGILNSLDPDIDGDGIANVSDEDVDGDGISNEQDTDDDGDEIFDDSDDSPIGSGIADDIDGDGRLNEDDSDIDGDGLLNKEDADVDGDGIPNGQDSDIDGDGLPNRQDPDMDGDMIINAQDADIDGDGLSNDIDPDMDGDGLKNEIDPDVDGDLILNTHDPDVDGDGVLNGEDPDVDGDGILNAVDPDIDADGIININDPDVDEDGVLNGEDPDVDGDGILNGEDSDVDGDGISNDQDGDMDGDGIANEDDEDIDGDGIENVSDHDADGDFILNEQDLSPRGRFTNVGVPEEPTQSVLKGAASNCFEINCSQDQKKDFFEDLIERNEGGLLTGVFTGVESNIVDFVVLLYESGYSLEDLSGSVITRRLAVEIAAQVLVLRGNISPDILELVTSDHYPDVDKLISSGRTINLLTDLGIVGGFPDGSFHGEFGTTFVQAAKIIVNTASRVSYSRVGTVLRESVLNDEVMDWFLPFLKTLDQLNITFISERISGYKDYENLGLDIDLIQYLRLFDKLSEVIGIDDILSLSQEIDLG
jgi:hypothetical protein